MTLDTPITELEDISIGTRQVLERHGLRTLRDVLAWRPDGSVHPFVIDNISALLEDLGYDWPEQA
jgi:hypothetical protein